MTLSMKYDLGDQSRVALASSFNHSMTVTMEQTFSLFISFISLKMYQFSSLRLENKNKLF